MAWPYPFALEKDIGPMDYTKGYPRRGYQYGDYAEFATGVAWANYVIGTNAYLQEAPRYPEFIPNPMVPGSPGFTADETAIIVTQDTYIRLNTATDVIRRLLVANSPYRFNERIYRIYVQRVAVNGAIYLYSEGNRVRTP